MILDPSVRWSRFDSRLRILCAFAGLVWLLATLMAAPARASADSWVYADKVVVFKSRRVLQLRKNGRVLKSFHVSLGLDPIGPKTHEGDMRTPEGHYVLDWKNPDSQYYMSIHMTYPNKRDRARARRLGLNPGGEVMIHGLPNQPDKPRAWYKHHDWTFGCIAVSDEAMQWIWISVRPGTPIVIKP